MNKRGTPLSHLSGIEVDRLRLDRNLLKDRAAETLREYISTGRIPEGTKLTEREVSRLLGISRMPAHEALTILEAEGLVVSHPGGRYVIELDEKDVRDLLALRVALESLAVELAAAHGNAVHQAVLKDRLRELEEAVDNKDPVACTKRDMALHKAIWQQADNPHLLRVLDSVLGAIWLLADRVKFYGQEDLQRLLDGHRRLVDQINAGDAEAAVRTIQAHLRSSLAQSLRTFQAPEMPGGRI
jgi:DNA-binding GntR family transcriptional regulator